MSSTQAGELTPTPLRLPEQALLPKMGRHSIAGYPQPTTMPAAQVARGFSCHGLILLSIVSQSPVKPSEPSFSTGNVGRRCFWFLSQALGQAQNPRLWDRSKFTPTAGKPFSFY